MDDPLNPTLQRLLALCRMNRTWVRGQGVWLFDESNRRFLDFYSQYGAVALGHNAPSVVAAVREALAQGVPAMVQPFGASYAIALAKELQRVAPGAMRRCIFTTSGAQAVETAIKLVRSKTGRPLILAAEGSFHGKTLGALALTGQPQYAEGFGALPPGFGHVLFGDTEALAARLQLEGERTAALFLEPIQGENGVIVPPPGYLKEARELCSRHGVALVLDEIQTGLGRTGRLFACEHDGVAPDVLLLAKALGGGLFPLGALLTSTAWWDERLALRHSATFANNNIACRAGLALLETLATDRLCDAATVRGEQLQAGLRQLAGRFPRLVADVRGRGLLCALELRPPAEEDGFFLSFLYHHGLYAYAVAGILADQAALLVLPTLGSTPVLRLAPALIISAAEIDDALDRLHTVFRQIERNRADTILRFLGALDEPLPLQNGHAAPIVLPPLSRRGRERETGTTASAPTQPQTNGYGRSDRIPRRFAFLVHYTRPEDVPLSNPSLAHWSGRDLRRFCSFLAKMPPGLVMPTGPIYSATGATTEGYLITVPLLPEEMARRGLRSVSRDIGHAVDIAAELGAQVVGLGAHTTPFSKRGRLVIGRGPAITTGSALTAGMTFAAVCRWLAERELELGKLNVAVVGAGGSVGRLCARLTARARPRRLILIGNPRRSSAPLLQFAEQLAWGRNTVLVDRSMSRLVECTVVISATGAVEPVLDDAPLASGTLICDVARPPDASGRVARRRDLTLLEGGLVAMPDSTLRFGAGNLVGLPDGIQLACVTETILLSLEGITEDRGIGDDVPLSEVDAIMALAQRHGFHLAPAPNGLRERAVIGGSVRVPQVDE